MNRSIISRSVLILLAGLYACAKNDDSSSLHSFRIFRENGVTIHETTGGPKYENDLFMYQEVLRIHSDESQPESILSWPGQFLRGEDGKYYLTDVREQRIVVFNSDGSFFQSYSRRGDGPGEFRNLYILDISGDVLTIYDAMRSRTSRLRTNGDVLSIVTCYEAPSSTLSLFPVNSGAKLLIWGVLSGEYPGPRYLTMSTVLLSASGDTLSELSTVPVWNGTAQRLERLSRTVFSMPHYKGASAIVFVPPDRIWMTTGADPEIQVHNLNGEIIRIIRVNAPREAISPEEKELIIRHYEDAIENASDETRRAAARKELEILRIDDTKDYWSGFFVDDAGYIWARATCPNESVGIVTRPLFKVFSPEGEYLGNTIWPTTRSGTVSQNQFLTFEIDEGTGERIPIVFEMISAIEGFEYP